jgi:hypothetical protein
MLFDERRCGEFLWKWLHGVCAGGRRKQRVPLWNIPFVRRWTLPTTDTVFVSEQLGGLQLSRRTWSLVPPVGLHSWRSEELLRPTSKLLSRRDGIVARSGTRLITARRSRVRTRTFMGVA